jgi:hypothetical protein
MIYMKWVVLAAIKLLLLVSLLAAPQIIALFTRAQYQGYRPYSWGGWWGTWDNPPQGDEGFVQKHAFFINELYGWRGYLNRVQWMWRNKLYGYNKWAAIQYSPTDKLEYIGSPDISDKYKLPGWYFVTLRRSNKLIGFEFYCVLPWSKARDLRARLGWKLLTRKFEQYGFAQLVTTANPFDGYGND